eukprot:TRINITY_DN30579_c0_g1_i1.p1 TRINITY_DN30579_c0_g1~~TRINITY_DN30579_c0_g1_i1.p1  ORF type:complete len:164 (+),score=44.16 TRINITY_DN30579_c0_g1_i1:131-622(+)
MVLAQLRGALTSLRQNGLLGSVKKAHQEGFWWSLLDGNLFHQKMREAEGKLVGEDSFGNKYYENMEAQVGRHRWVEYKDKYNYNASTVPPEWHGWLHHISDYKPEDLEELKPIYHKAHKPNVTGAGNYQVYLARGHPLHPGQREWKKAEDWAVPPPSSSSSTP